MRDLIEWIANEGQGYGPVVHTALTHEIFLAIHPLLDRRQRPHGAAVAEPAAHARWPFGRAAAGQPAATIYIGALKQAHHGQYSALINVIESAVEIGLDMFLEACAAVPDELQRLLREVAEECDIKADYLG